MISDFKVGDFVGLEDYIGAPVAQVIATPDTDYTIGNDFVRVIWLDGDIGQTMECSHDLHKLECAKLKN